MIDRLPQAVFITSPERGEIILNVLVDGELVKYDLSKSQIDRLAVESVQAALRDNLRADRGL